MKNVVKKCKSQKWIAWVSGIVFGIATYYFMNYFRANNSDAAQYACMIMGGVGFIMFYYASLQSIWAKAFQKKYDIKYKREKNHSLLIQKTLNSGDKEKSKELLNKYNDAKYCNTYTFVFLKGVYLGKFSKEINVINN